MIYFDHNATTPIIPEVRNVINEAMEKYWGNPSSAHSIGKEALRELGRARIRLAGLLDVKPSEIYFTSGGTEADNIALIGCMKQYPRSHMVISDIEHPAITKASNALLYEHDIQCTRIPVDGKGCVQVSRLAESLMDRTKLISVMYANNEIGTIQPIKEIGELASKKNILFHSDAIQAFGKVPINIQKENISLLSISSHKIYGPKGCGALYIKEGTLVLPCSYGGSQEHGLRVGTQNLPAVLGFVKSAEIAYENRDIEKKYLFGLTEFFYKKLTEKIENIIRNGDPENRIPGTLNVSFPGTVSGMIVDSMNEIGICISGGAACSSDSYEPSHVLTAIGRRKIEAISGVRFSLGRSNSEEEVNQATISLTEIISELRDGN